LQQNEASSQVKMHLLNEYHEKWRAAATKLVRLLKYVSLNMQALRKTVKKQHKVVRSLPPHAHISWSPYMTSFSFSAFAVVHREHSVWCAM
jgi:hypothetical protein